jgi:diguanylate cyclase
MSDETERWKEKYLHSLEQQEQLERRWSARLDLLRRGLVRSTLAAEGNDRAVDQCMKEMREVVRTDDMDARLMSLLPRLEKAVLDSEQRRETRVEQTGNALAALVAQLQGLDLPREVRNPLKKFARQVEERAAQAREVPLLLGELSVLQGQALALLDKPLSTGRQGLLQRLFGSSEEAQRPPAIAPEADSAVSSGPEAPSASVPELALPPVPVLEQAPIPLPSEPLRQPAPEPEPEQEFELELEREPQPQRSAALPAAAPSVLDIDTGSEPDDATRPIETLGLQLGPPALVEPSRPTPIVQAAGFVDSFPLPEVMAEALAAIDPEDPGEDVLYALPPSPEPSYSSVAGHIEDTLLGLLDNLSLPEGHRPQAESMRQRLEHGLNWYELLPILDDFAVLTLAISDSGQHEFERYLQALNQRLESFQGNLQAASEGHADNRSAAHALDSELREQVGGLQSSVQGATDVDSLKSVLDNRLAGLLDTMDSHRQAQNLREQAIAERLQGLSERVVNMEREAQDYREHLEEQRQKALVDALTGLPNRAAWSERLEQEVASQASQGNSLLLVMLDLDHFKSINDGYGHLAGDKVLKIIATQLGKRLRPRDFMARFGGEEFVLLMPDTSLVEGAAPLEALRLAVAESPFHFKGQRVTVTASMGVTAFKPGENSDAVLKRADQALYRAKANGRNRIEAG